MLGILECLTFHQSSHNEPLFIDPYLVRSYMDTFWQLPITMLDCTVSAFCKGIGHCGLVMAIFFIKSSRICISHRYTQLGEPIRMTMYENCGSTKQSKYRKSRFWHKATGRWRMTMMISDTIVVRYPTVIHCGLKAPVKYFMTWGALENLPNYAHIRYQVGPAEPLCTSTIAVPHDYHTSYIYFCTASDFIETILKLKNGFQETRWSLQIHCWIDNTKILFNSTQHNSKTINCASIVRSSTPILAHQIHFLDI